MINEINIKVLIEAVNLEDGSELFNNSTELNNATKICNKKIPSGYLEGIIF